MNEQLRKANKRSEETKAKIHRAFMDLTMKHCKTSDITVKEVCLKAGIGRSTFYLYYKDTEFLEKELIQIFLEEIISLLPPKVEGIQDVIDFVNSFFDYIEMSMKNIRFVLKEQEELVVFEKVKLTLFKAFTSATEKAHKNFNRARAVIVANGMFGGVHQFITKTIHPSLEELRNETISLCEGILDD